MPYSYRDLRPKLFTEKGVRDLLDVQRSVIRQRTEIGQIVVSKTISGTGVCDPWTVAACLEYLAEINQIRLVAHDADQPLQDRTYR